MMSPKAKISSSILSFLFIIVLFSTVGFGQKSDNHNEIIVKFKKEHSPKHFKSSVSDLSNHPALAKVVLKPRKTSLISGGVAEDVHVMRFDATNDISKIIESYKASGLFEYVESNFISQPFAGGDKVIVPNDKAFNMQWGLKNDGNLTMAYSSADSDIDADKAWVFHKGSSSIKVAILDSGVDYLHPDLVNRMWRNTNEIPNNGIDDDYNGLIDDYHGWDFAEGHNDPMDTNGHGTHVAGIIGAEANNGIGITGIDWHAQIMPIKVIRNDKTASYSDYASAVYYAVAQGANVINISLTSYEYSQTVEDAFAFAHNQGVVIVVAMANNGNQTIHYMAQSQYSIAVGATTPMDQRASFSNYNNYIDVVAPGAYIYSLNLKSDTDLRSMNGTSQAAPFVAGLASMLLAQDRSRSPDKIRWLIRETADDQVGSKTEDFPGFDIYFGHGRINAHKALSYQATGVEGVASAQQINGNQNETANSEEFEALVECSEIYSDQFSAGLGIWNLGGKDASLVWNSPTKKPSILLQDNSGVYSSVYTKPTDYRSYEALEITISMTLVGVGFGESMILEVSNDFGISYDEIEVWSMGYDLPLYARNTRSTIIDASYLSEHTILRLRADASSNRDRFFIDEFSIAGCKTYFDNSLSAEIENIETGNSARAEESSVELSFLKIYPNPASDYIMIDRSLITYNTFSVFIHSMDGRHVFTSQFSVDDEVMIDITGLSSAQQYIVTVVSAEAKSPLSKSFVKS